MRRRRRPEESQERVHRAAEVEQGHERRWELLELPASAGDGRCGEGGHVNEHQRRNWLHVSTALLNLSHIRS